MNKKTSATNFSKIDSPQDLISYLSNSKKRLTKQKSNGAQYVYHYTKLSNVVSIIKSRSWWLKSPETMNDGLEFKNISESQQCNAVFFASFMYDSSKVSLCGRCMLNHGKMACLYAYLLRYS